MKQIACGDVVPGCTATWQRESDQDILAAVAEHASRDHGMAEVPAEVVDAVKSKIVDV